MGRMHGKHGMGMGGMEGGPVLSGAADAANRIPDCEALLANMTHHSQDIANLSDSDSRSSESLRKQPMLDQPLELTR